MIGLAGRRDGDLTGQSREGGFDSRSCSKYKNMETTELKRRIYGRLDRLAMKEEKEVIVSSFTSGRTTHLSEMTEEELLGLLERLGGHTSLPGTDRWGWFDNKNQQHMYILSLCQQLGWVKYHPKLQRNVADLTRLGRWIGNFGAYKKPLMQMNVHETQKIIVQLEQMLIKHYAR